MKGGQTMSNARIINALKVIQEEAPDYFDGIITGDCPSDLGLLAINRDRCGMEDTTSEFTSEYCTECWRMALGDEQ